MKFSGVFSIVQLIFIGISSIIAIVVAFCVDTAYYTFGMFEAEHIGVHLKEMYEEREQLIETAFDEKSFEKLEALMAPSVLAKCEDGELREVLDFIEGNVIGSEAIYRDGSKVTDGNIYFDSKFDLKLKTDSGYSYYISGMDCIYDNYSENQGIHNLAISQDVDYKGRHERGESNIVRDKVTWIFDVEAINEKHFSEFVNNLNSGDFDAIQKEFFIPEDTVYRIENDEYHRLLDKIGNEITAFEPVAYYDNPCQPDIKTNWETEFETFGRRSYGWDDCYTLSLWKVSTPNGEFYIRISDRYRENEHMGLWSVIISDTLEACEEAPYYTFGLKVIDE